MGIGNKVVGALADTVAGIVSAMMPRKTFDEVVEGQNTKKVSFFRVHGWSPVYTYGKRPGEPLVKHERHPEGIAWPSVAPEEDPAVIGDHIAICSREKGSGGGLCELCQKLDNPERRAFLVRLYKDGRTPEQAGFNVGEAVDKSKLKQPATSQYLRQLSALGLIRRERHGRIVSYCPEVCGATPCVRDIAEMMRERWRRDATDEAFVPIFHVMMGPFRACVVRWIAAGGCGAVESLAERYGKKPSDVIRLLDWAVKGGVLELSSEDSEGVYRYITPADPIARRIVELS